MLVRFSAKKRSVLSWTGRILDGRIHEAHGNAGDVIAPGTAEGISLLELAVIYGANASGKSNLVKAYRWCSVTGVVSPVRLSDYSS